MGLQHTRLSLESLESREVPSVGATLGYQQLFGATHRVLVVEGSTGDDEITVAPSSSLVVGSPAPNSASVSVTIRHPAGVYSRTFSLLNSDILVINALDGNDTVRNQTSLQSQIQCGAGNDTVYGGANTDTIFGSDGDDRLDGGAGFDSIYGEGGDDALQGGIDDDYLNGGDGSDLLDGLGGNDFLDGGDGEDALLGASGNDILHGGGGNDYLYGEWGDDSLYGGFGTDHLLGGDGNDYLDGGDGFDYLFGEAGDDCFGIALNQPLDYLNSGTGTTTYRFSY